MFVRRKEVAQYLDRMNILVYRRLLQMISSFCEHMPAPVLRQRLIFFAWYTLSVEAAREGWLASRGRSDLWTQTDPQLNLIETATALIEAPIPLASEKPKPRAIRKRRRSE